MNSELPYTFIVENKTLGVFRSFFLGFNAPLQCLKYLIQNKAILVMSLAPHLIGFIVFLWTLQSYIAPKLLIFIMSHSENFLQHFLKIELSSTTGSIFSFIIQILCWFFGLFFYGVFGTSAINIISSPLQDIVATKCYQTVAHFPHTRFHLFAFILSLAREVLKLCVLFLFLFIFVLLPLFIPGGFFYSLVVTPFVLIVTAWFNGWDYIDRTLGLLGQSFSKRLSFAKKFPYTCIGLGCWSVIPFISSFTAFCLSGGGGIIAARLLTPSQTAPAHKK